MPEFSVYDPRGESLGEAYSHHLPRAGDGFEFQNNTWRAVDIFHPTQDQPGVAIVLPKVKARIEDIPWLDSEEGS